MEYYIGQTQRNFEISYKEHNSLKRTSGKNLILLNLL